MPESLDPFHYAFVVDDLGAARRFYGDSLGLPIGRSDSTWIDFNLYGHQIVAHLNPDKGHHAKADHRNPVDGHDVPVPHFGVVLKWDDWHELAGKLKRAGVDFVIEPYIKFKGQIGEHATMFLLDPSGNALEFKSFQDRTRLFAS